MHQYFEFIQEWIGIGFAVPLLYVFFLFGPITLFVWGGSRREAVKSVGLFAAACALVAHFFFCLGTGIYLGRFHGLNGWGMLLGLFVFGSSLGLYVYLARLPRR